MLIAQAATWRLHKSVGEDAEAEGSRLRRSEHRVELLPSAAARPGQGGGRRDASISSKTSHCRLPEAAEPKLTELSILPCPRSGKLLSQVFIQDQSKQICSARPERSPSA